MSRLHLHRACSLSTSEVGKSLHTPVFCPWGSSGRVVAGPSSCRLCTLRTQAALYSNTNAATPAAPIPVATPEFVGATSAQYNSELALEVQRLEQTFSKTPEDIPVHDVAVLGPSWTRDAGNMNRFAEYARATKTVEDVQQANRELSALLQELSGWDTGSEVLQVTQPTASTPSRKQNRSQRSSTRQQKRSTKPQSNVVSTEVLPPTVTTSPAPAGPARRKFLQATVVQETPATGNIQAKLSSDDAVTPGARKIAQQRASRYRRQSAAVPRSSSSTAATGLEQAASVESQYQASTKNLFKGTGEDNLLSGEQEKVLALKVKEFLAFEELEKKLAAKLGRPPEAREMAAAAKLDYITFKTRWDAGKAAKKRMIECNLRLVIAVAKKEAGTKLTDIGIDSLVAEGMQGLLKGIERFDHTKGFRFSTYAHWWIRQAVQRCMQLESSVVRLPEYVAGDEMKVRRALAAYKTKHNMKPTSKELSKLTGISESRVRAVLEHSHRVNVASLEAGFENENDEREYVVAASTDDPFEDADNNQLRSDLEQMLGQLEPREAMVLKARYGLDADGQPRTLEEVGGLFNLTRERIRQIETAALKKLRSTSALALTEHTMEDLKMSGRRAGGLRKHS